ncbi:allophanate hydrolase subunit 1 [Paracoccus sp. DMF-8]|uniref:5-oxoprolinase subunit B family protein n=1 Tax=Paracoccus sp. DMF-8 TaxID=3019445 RepID=UPI0023E7AB08|nr:allophanate hydrolase subunit 1 [Paracoccus sp. DMF-8]MDF3605065.1 allophanate hydrolase subunit 1 [Paracoccus sp. DMF-8]
MTALHPIAEHALLVEFGRQATDQAHDQVLALDAALTGTPPVGIRQTIPAHASLMIEFDPAQTDHNRIGAAVQDLLSAPAGPRPTPAEHLIDICYDGPCAPDLDAVARASGLDREQAAACHLSGEYRVRIYGFAPGYAYLSGVPEPLRLPRKPKALRDVPAGSVLIAGGQCIISTLTMPTGWWIVGRSPARILTGDPARPFLFDIGDIIRFRRIPESALR